MNSWAHTAAAGCRLQMLHIKNFIILYIYDIKK